VRRLLAVVPLLVLALAACETEPMTDADIGYFDATLQGEGECQDEYTVTFWFEYGTTPSGAWDEGPHQDVDCPDLTQSVPISQYVDGLSDRLQFRYRLCGWVGTNPTVC
jgi:hypothetical protein